jgi:hypothetical protein
MTGASGGGYNTWITSALDDRIKVAVPVVGTSANNHEFAAMVAPRPLLIIAASQGQSFPIEGVRAVYRYSRDLYGSLKAGRRSVLLRTVQPGTVISRRSVKQPMVGFCDGSWAAETVLFTPNLQRKRSPTTLPNCGALRRIKRLGRELSRQ